MKFYVESYGCTMNQGETEMIAETLEEEGHVQVDSLDEADKALIGTCVVIKKTEERMKRRIEELEEKCSEVIIAGCLSSTRKKEIQERCSSLDFIQPSDVEMSKNPLKSKENSFIGTIPISSGCVGNCTYCITRLARGDIKSRSLEDIKERFEQLLSTSTKEIRLTSQDTALYGKDLNTNIIELLGELLKIKGDYRIRIGMMNVDALKPLRSDFMDLMEDDRVYKFLHLPLQSGSDRILKKMNRNYNVKEWSDIVEEFRERFSNLTLSTDVIVGFPGETKKDFEKTKRTVKKAKPDVINVTRFSPREGTKAAEMENKVHSRKKKNRSKEMTDLRFKISRELNERYVGKRTEVLVLEKGKEDSLKSRMDNYKVVILQEEDEGIIGEWKEVEIKSAEDIYLLGEIVK
ncbi:MAG: tRNA (N(6)-L-threonylcarbamoyladenosine(37)-C(2))-methylthiotransferase [Candidatus Thermoplasmatota archaeon]|nr:tRNA (N(6)-L-threonylcarbamoyladenosine(37)-C(2))-methylthiotransferase [Candidatus Thermoplasmatota archaeon]